MSNEHAAAKSQPSAADYMKAIEKELVGIHSQADQLTAFADLMRRRAKTVADLLLQMQMVAGQKLQVGGIEAAILNADQTRAMGRMLSSLNMTPAAAAAMTSIVKSKDIVADNEDATFASIGQASSGGLGSPLENTDAATKHAWGSNVFETCNDYSKHGWPFVHVIPTYDGRTLSLIPLLEKYFSPAIEVKTAPNGRPFFGRGFIKSYPYGTDHPLSIQELSTDVQNRDPMGALEILNLAKKLSTGWYRFKPVCEINSEYFILSTSSCILVFDIERVLTVNIHRGTHDEPWLFVRSEHYKENDNRSYQAVIDDIELALTDLAAKCG